MAVVDSRSAPRDMRLMANLTWSEFGDRLGRSVLMLPIGAVEQHGPHLPLDTDNRIPLALALELAQRVAGVVAPPLSYGYKSQPFSGGGRHFPGTTSLDGATLVSLVADVVRDLTRQGQTRFLLLNGNYENTFFVLEGMDLAIRQSPSEPKIVLVNWWELLPTDYLQQVFGGNFPGWEAEHAGIIETSLMMRLYPELVLVDRIGTPEEWRGRPYSVAPEPRGLVPPSGVLRGAQGATKEIGEQVFAYLLDRLTEVVTTEFPTSEDRNVSD